jgi:hypothetical protein
LEKRIDPATLTDDELAQRWKAWLQHTKQEAYEFYAFRFKAENINKMFIENEALQSEGGASLHDWIFELHKTYCLTSIRRELEGGPHQNLVSFLYEVERFSERVFTRRRFVAMYGEDLIQFGTADNDFDRTPGAACRWPRTSPDEDFISKESICAARESLKKFAKPVLEYMNWRLAHRTDAHPPEVTWGDVNRTMNRIFDTYARFYLLLTGNVYVSRYPEPQYNWLQPFTVPWTTHEFAPWQKPNEPEDP